MKGITNTDLKERMINVMYEMGNTEKNDPVEDAKKVIKVFADMKSHDDDIKEIKDDLKEMIDIFCEQNDTYTPKQIKAGYKYFVQYQKDRQAQSVEELERDKMIEIIEGV